MISTSITDNNEINNALLNIGKKNKNNIVKAAVEKFTNPPKNAKKDIKTHTEQLSKEQIKELLEDYSQVTDINNVCIGTHIRYFSKLNGENKFRMGGNLKLIEKEYVILKNAVNVEWSVQIKDTTFFKKMTMKDIKDEYENIIEDLHDKIKKLKAENKLLKDDAIKLEKKNENTTKVYKNVKKK
jgi:hypothetical protein